MEIQSGNILWARNKDLPLPPASTVKILTALVVLEDSRINDSVNIPIAATRVTGSTVQLKGGERISVRELLYGLLVGSGNDAAIALASHVSGSVAKFTELMNEKARRLGALNSRFRNPTGLPQHDQVSTARDLAVITRAVLAIPEFRAIVATKSYLWKSAKWQGLLTNSNRLLQTYEGAIGVKTGNTKEAGYCLVAAAKRGKAGYIAVLLNSREKVVWEDAKRLLDHGFRNPMPISLLDFRANWVNPAVEGKTATLVAAAAARYNTPQKGVWQGSEKHDNP